MTAHQRLYNLLTTLYGESLAKDTLNRLLEIINSYDAQIPKIAQTGLSERDAILITYPDQVSQTGSTPLRTLTRFCEENLHGMINAIHLLPFFPFSSDDGFSVIDYKSVAPQFGDWEDISRLSRHFHLMFDGVINHISAKSAWFQAFLNDDPFYRNFFIVVEDSPDLSAVIRPRAFPLLHSFQTPSGEKQVWTTFSTDQIDLNYANPDVLLKIIDVLLFYVAHGARFIRLDAIAYLWKKISTPCIHLPETHAVIQLFRAILDEVAPFVKLITETNVPHRDNISYFGNGENEAQLVYNFALPPLLLDAIYQADASILSNWAATLALPSPDTAFFNFLASHDGIGINPVRGILPDSRIDEMVATVLKHAGYVSYKMNPDSSQSPYELNINYFDALSNPDGDEPPVLQVSRFMVSQAIMLALVGVPGIYFHSLVGSRGWRRGVEQSGLKRAINRQKLNYQALADELQDPGSIRAQVFNSYTAILRARASSPAFNPNAKQEILNCGKKIFAVLRIGSEDGERVYCLHNISDGIARVDLPQVTGELIDLITGSIFTGKIELFPYQICWLRQP